MKKDRLKEIPTAELIDKEKSARTATYLLVGTLLVLFAAILYSFKSRGFDIIRLIVPSVILICLFVNFNIIKNMHEELSNRNIDKFK